jgi:hypothetical protein
MIWIFENGNVTLLLYLKIFKKISILLTKQIFTQLKVYRAVAEIWMFSSIKRKNIEALKTQPTKVNRNHNGIVIGSKAVIIGSNWLKKINNWLKLAQIKNLYYLCPYESKSI